MIMAIVHYIRVAGSLRGSQPYRIHKLRQLPPVNRYAIAPKCLLFSHHKHKYMNECEDERRVVWLCV